MIFLSLQSPLVSVKVGTSSRPDIPSNELQALPAPVTISFPFNTSELSVERKWTSFSLSLIFYCYFSFSYVIVCPSLEKNFCVSF